MHERVVLRKLRRVAGTLGLVLGIGLAGACTGTRAGAAVDVGEKAPPFALAVHGGGRYDLYATLADHPVLVAFISMPCAPCEESIPGLERICDLHDRTDSMEVVCIAVTEPATVAHMIRQDRFRCRATVLVEEAVAGSYPTADAYGVLGTPMFFLVGRDGTVLWTHIGRLRPETAREAIAAALGR